MEDTLWIEIADAPGEIWDLPEMQDEEEDEQTWNQFVNGNVTLWSLAQGGLTFPPFPAILPLFSIK